MGLYLPINKLRNLHKPLGAGLEENVFSYHIIVLVWSVTILKRQPIQKYKQYSYIFILTVLKRLNECKGITSQNINILPTVQFLW